MMRNPTDQADPMGIAALRRRLGLTQSEFGEKIGIASKGDVSMIERGLRPISLRAALAIESLSDGAIDAASLCDEVAAARAAARTPSIQSQSEAA